VTFEVELTPAANIMLKGITDARERAKLIEVLRGLAKEPETKGKPLTGDLLGYRSLRAVGQRYRIIYRVERGLVTVIVVAVGRRKAGSKRDIYELARKLIRSRLVEKPKRE
jgi:mRNA interferase RelE/StbE